MPLNVRPSFGRPAIACIGLLLFWGCQGNTSIEDARVQRYEQRMADSQPFEFIPPLTPVDQPAPVELAGRITTTQPALDTVLWLHVPDPIMAPTAFAKRLETSRFSSQIRTEYERIYKDATRYIREIERPRQFRLTLAEAIRRALVNNYQISVDSYAPAISTAQVVQAEAAFDTAFFSQVSREKIDRRSTAITNNRALLKIDQETTVIAAGLRQFLVSGAQVSLTQSMTKVYIPFQVNVFSPAWQQSFIAEIRQPTLRNFGIDFNRAQINIRKTERKINEEAFRGRVIEILNNTERAYWDLVRARRDVTIGAEILAQSELTLSQIEARKDYDAYQTLLYRSQTNVNGRRFEFIGFKNTVRNAEDQLLNLLNDPEIPMSAGFEIIPADNPTTIEFVRDHFHEVEVALQRRPEILQARHAVDVTRLQLGIAKNQALPQLDVIYRATLNGVGPSSDSAFDQMTGADFIDHFIGMEFAWNFGERAERAGIRIAALQQSQAAAAYKQALDNVITDCRVVLRNLETSHEQLGPSRDAVMSAFDSLRALQERQERKSPPELDSVFNAQSALAQSRRALLQAVVGYNQGIVDVERAKGTLLDYDNVILTGQP